MDGKLVEQIVALLEPLSERDRMWVMYEISRVYCSECGGPAYPYEGLQRYCQCSNDE